MSEDNQNQNPNNSEAEDAENFDTNPENFFQPQNVEEKVDENEASFETNQKDWLPHTKDHPPSINFNQGPSQALPFEHPSEKTRQTGQSGFDSFTDGGANQKPSPNPTSQSRSFFDSNSPAPTNPPQQSNQNQVSRNDAAHAFFGEPPAQQPAPQQSPPSQNAPNPNPKVQTTNLSQPRKNQSLHPSINVNQGQGGTSGHQSGQGGVRTNPFEEQNQPGRGGVPTTPFENQAQPGQGGVRTNPFEEQNQPARSGVPTNPFAESPHPGQGGVRTDPFEGQALNVQVNPASSTQNRLPLVNKPKLPPKKHGQQVIVEGTAPQPQEGAGNEIPAKEPAKSNPIDLDKIGETIKNPELQAIFQLIFIQAKEIVTQPEDFYKTQIEEQDLVQPAIFLGVYTLAGGLITGFMHINLVYTFQFIFFSLAFTTLASVMAWKLFTFHGSQKSFAQNFRIIAFSQISLILTGVQFSVLANFTALLALLYSLYLQKIGMEMLHDIPQNKIVTTMVGIALFFAILGNFIPHLNY